MLWDNWKVDYCINIKNNFFYQSILERAAVVIDLLNLDVSKVLVLDTLVVIGVRYNFENSSEDKSENFVIP